MPRPGTGRLKTGTVDSHGNLVVNTTMSVNTYFGPHFRVRAEFVRSGSGDHNLSTYNSWQCFEYKA